MKRGALSKTEKFWIAGHRDEDVSELAEDLDRSVKIVKSYIETLPDVGEDLPIDLEAREIDEDRVGQVEYNHEKGLWTDVATGQEFEGPPPAGEEATFAEKATAVGFTASKLMGRNDRGSAVMTPGASQIADEAKKAYRGQKRNQDCIHRPLG